MQYLSPRNENFQEQRREHERERNRLPMLDDRRGLQNMNNSANFEYQDDPFAQVEADSDDYDISHGDYQQQSRRSNVSRATISRLSYGQSSNKTGGVIKLEPKPQDLARDPYIGRDAITVIEGEWRQFENRKFDKLHRYVEQIVTGEFLKVQKDLDLQKGVQEIEYGQTNQKKEEDILKKQQIAWINRLNALFTLMLGFLAGMSVMHILIIGYMTDKKLFLEMYYDISRFINFAFLLLCNFTLMLGVTISIIYKQIADEKMRVRDPERTEFKKAASVSFATTGIVFIAWILLFVLPHFTNQISKYNAKKSSGQIEDITVMLFKILSGIVDVLLIIAWLIISSSIKSRIGDSNLVPDDSDSDVSDDDDSTEVGEGETN